MCYVSASSGCKLYIFLKQYSSLGYRKMTHVLIMHANPVRHNFKYFVSPYNAKVQA